MAYKETVVWGIHAGKTGAADDLFLKKNYVALGWSQMGDLSKLQADREAFKAKVVECWPDWKEGRIRNSAGQTFRFVHEMNQEMGWRNEADRDRRRAKCTMRLRRSWYAATRRPIAVLPRIRFDTILMLSTNCSTT